MRKAMILFICLVGLLSGCSAPKVVTEHHYEEKTNNVVLRDSIFQRDSIFTFIKGDTIRIVEDHYFYRTISNTDSVYVVKVDSVPVVVEVPAKLSKMQRFKLDTWGYVSGAILFLFILLIAIIRTKIHL